MFAVVVPSLFGLFLVAVWIYAVVDVVTTDRELVRNLPKTAWVLVVVVLWVIGAVLWFAAGRPTHGGLGLRPGARRADGPGHDGEIGSRRRRRPLGPEDEDGWSRFQG